MDLESNGPELHAHDCLVAVTAVRCRGESDHVSGAHLTEHSFEGHRRCMVALINDDLSVFCHEVIDRVGFHKTLHHGDIDPAGAFTLLAGSSADPTDLGLVDSEEERELPSPLIE